VVTWFSQYSCLKEQNSVIIWLLHAIGLIYIPFCGAQLIMKLGPERDLPTYVKDVDSTIESFGSNGTK
jgi:hypothetical protein